MQESCDVTGFALITGPVPPGADAAGI